VSPNGNLLVGAEVYIGSPTYLPVAGGRPDVRPQQGSAVNHEVAWRPSGRQLVAIRGPRLVSGLPWLSTISLQGIGIRRLGTNVWGALDVSSTGQIAYSRRVGDRFDVWVTQRGKDRRIATGASSPTWAPHGTKLAYLKINYLKRMGSICVRPVKAGAKARCIARNLPFNTDPQPNLVWSPDGKRLAFPITGTAENPFALATIPAAGGKVRPIPGSRGFLQDWQPLPSVPHR
jgi:hypothetical protein